MRGLILAFALSLALGLGLGWATITTAAPPVLPAQPHPDQFEVAGYGNIAPLSPVYAKAKETHAISYRLVTMPGCVAGTIPADMQRVEAEAQTKLGFTLRQSATPDFIVRINCGSEQIRICGAVTIFCLGRGFPYTNDVDLSDILSTYQPDTRLAIPLHEIMGHAVQVASEQYCTGGEPTGVCRGLAQFTPAPNWSDFMNTGPLSRHGFEAVELGRWERLMYSLAPEPCGDPCFDGTSWVFADGWKFKPNAGCGEWTDPSGRLFWGGCDTWGGGARWNDVAKLWIAKDGSAFDPARGIWYRLVSPPLP